MDYSTEQATQWYGDGNDAPHASVVQRVKLILDTQSTRRNSVRRCQQLYGVDLSAYGMAPDATIDRRYAINHLKNSVDTLAAKISRAKVLPFAVTAGGDYMQRKRAEKLSRFIDGAFNDTRFWEKSLYVDLATLVDGTGCIKVTSNYGQLQLEVVPMLDVFIDDAESRYGQPRNMIQRHLVDRSVVRAMYAHKKATQAEGFFGPLDVRRAAIDSVSVPTDSEIDRKSTRLNSSHTDISRMPSSA